MPQFFKDFQEHPHSVGETYGQHWWSAMGFAVRLLGCAVACAVHAFLPGLCKTTASRSLDALHRHMVTHRHRAAAESDGTLRQAGVSPRRFAPGSRS